MKIRRPQRLELLATLAIPKMLLSNDAVGDLSSLSIRNNHGMSVGRVEGKVDETHYYVTLRGHLSPNTTLTVGMFRIEKLEKRP